MRFSTILLALILPFPLQHALAQQEAEEKKSVESEHQRAVELAHADQHDAALVILKDLLASHPDNYPIRRDYVVISGWKGDCDEALEKFQPIKNHPGKEDYLIGAVAECMRKARQTDEALAVLREGARAYPENEDIKTLYKSLLNDIVIDRKPELNVKAGTGQSDAGNQDYFFEIKYSRQFAPAARWFARYFTTFADDPEFDTGDLNRVGAGVMYWFDPKWYLEQEFSTDIDEGGDNGSTTTLVYHPTLLWEVFGQYASFAEDVPLRAKALGVDSDRLTISAFFHTIDYRWEWYGSYSAYEFSDSNDRESYYTSLGYAYEMTDTREQRVILELSGSTNTLDNTVYFNPERDTTIAVVHRTSFIFDSRYDSHVDHLSVFLGQYDQEGYGADATYGASYEQQYDFSPVHSFSWWLEAASRIYDGERETVGSFLASYTRKFL
ncbi:MAG: hypothetical protein L0Z73_02400 [Gammaproteobacteria bacterium]|nr:hypothetical protein [Gammaproteobacteria bacterium]